MIKAKERKVSYMDMIKTGKFIAQLRREKGLTQQALAERLYVTAKTVSRWENGNYMPPIDALPALSEILGATIAEIIAGERLAEENSEQAEQAALNEAESRFSLEEKKAYYKKKWLRERGIFPLIIMVGIAILMVAAALNDIWWAFLIEAVALGVDLGLFRNAMMAYIEKNAFDGKGQ